MKSDLKTNFDVELGIVAAAVTDAAAVSASVNGADVASACFLASASAVATTLTGALEFSDDDSTFVASTDARNTVGTVLDDAGVLRADVVVWEGQYARLSCTSVGASTFGITNVAGPKYSVAAE